MWEIFEKLLLQRGLSSADVARATGISTPTFTYWKNGRSTPKIDKLQKIADYLGVSLEYLTTGKDSRVPFPNIPPDIVEIIDMYSKLSDKDKNTIKDLLITLSGR